MSNAATIKVTCTRCKGSGNYSFNHFHGTVCFKCSGAGTVQMTEAAYLRSLQPKKARAAKPLSETVDITLAFGLARPTVERAMSNPQLLAYLMLTIEDYKTLAARYENGERQILRADLKAAHARYEEGARV